MSDIDELQEFVSALMKSHAELQDRFERTFRYGNILGDDDVDLSDPRRPVARIHIDLDDDGQAVKGPWVRYATWAGDHNSHMPPSAGMQFLQVALDGEHEAGLLIPLGHSDAIPSPETDRNTHVSTFGQTKTTLKKDSFTRTVGGSQLHTDTENHKVTTPGQIVHAAGDPAAANSTGAGSLVNLPHELNRILQGVMGRLAQHDHHIAALHDQASSLVDLALPKVPELAALQPTLNHQPQGLKMAADQVLPHLPDYVSNVMTQALVKLTASPLGLVMEIAQGDVAGQIGGLLDQVEGLASGAGIDVADVMGQARLAAAAAAAGGTFELAAASANLASAFAGTPAAGAFATLQGQLTGVMTSTASLMSGLSGLLDGQINAAKGTIKSYLLGGY